MLPRPIRGPPGRIACHQRTHFRGMPYLPSQPFLRKTGKHIGFQSTGHRKNLLEVRNVSPQVRAGGKQEYHEAVGCHGLLQFGQKLYF